MQIIIDIKDENIADKIVWFLKSFSDKGVEIREKEQTLDSEIETLSDEYIKENWKNIVSESLANYDANYTKSFQYKLDRAKFRDMKEAL